MPPVFDFLHMSAGVRNSLGHEAATPAEKLAGMKLAHFGGFLEAVLARERLAVGRLDGVEHAVGAALDHEYLAPLARQAPGFVGELGELAFPGGTEPGARGGLGADGGPRT